MDEVVAGLVPVRAANAAAGFTTRAVKIMVDGVPENGTAALPVPFCRSESRGGHTARGLQDAGLAYLPHDVLLAGVLAGPVADRDPLAGTAGNRVSR